MQGWIAVRTNQVYTTDLGSEEEEAIEEANRVLRDAAHSSVMTSKAAADKMYYEVENKVLRNAVEQLKEENAKLLDNQRKTEENLGRMYRKAAGLIKGGLFITIFVLFSLWFPTADAVGGANAVMLTPRLVEKHLHFPKTICEFDYRTGPFLEVGGSAEIASTRLGNNNTVEEVMKAYHQKIPLVFLTQEVNWKGIAAWCDRHKTDQSGCFKLVSKILTPRECVGNQLVVMAAQITEFAKNLEHAFWLTQNKWISIVIEVVILSLSLILRGDWRIIAIVFICRFICGIPTFIITIMLNWLNSPTFLLVSFWQFTSLFYGALIGLITWTFTTVWAAITAENVMVEISKNTFFLGLAVLLHVIIQIVIGLKLSVFWQMFWAAAFLTVMAGVKHAMAKTVVTSSDGKTLVYQHWLGQESVYKLLCVAQKPLNFIRQQFGQKKRGVIPKFPYKGRSVVFVWKKDDEDTHGSGFRFGNYIYTLEHIIGQEAKTAMVQWEHVQVECKVKSKIPLEGSVEKLVQLQLDKELVGIPPLKRTKDGDSDYGNLWWSDEGEPWFFAGWIERNNEFLTSCFATVPGTSGGAYVDRFGRLMGIHIGSKGVISTGLWLGPYFDMMADTKPLVKQVVYCWPDGTQHDEPYVPPNSKANPPEKKKKKQEVKPTEVSSSDGVVRQEAGSGIDPDVWNCILDMMVKVSRDNVGILTGQIQELREAVDTIRQEKKKGKTKARRRLMQAAHGGAVKVRAMYHKIMKSKVLTEEEYKRLQEEGKSPQEIRDLVNQLRYEAWKQFCIDRNIDPDTGLQEEDESEYSDESYDTDEYDEDYRNNEFNEDDRRYFEKYEYRQEGFVKDAVDFIRKALFGREDIEEEQASSDDEKPKSPTPSILKPVEVKKEEPKKQRKKKDLSVKKTLKKEDFLKEDEKPGTSEAPSEGLRQEVKKNAFRYGRKPGPKLIMCYTCQDEHPPGKHTKETVLCRGCKQEVAQQGFQSHVKACKTETKNGT
nr:MAG: ORF1a [Astroviridae sp.]